MNTECITDAIRGVILGELGSTRTVPAGAWLEGLAAPMQADDARGLRAHAGAKSFDVEVQPPTRTNAVGPTTASRAILRVDVMITLTYAITAVAESEGAGRRHAVRAQAADDARTIALALTWPPNLAVDRDGDATGLVSGALIEGAPPRRKREDWRAGLYELELYLYGYALDTQPVA